MTGLIRHNGLAAQVRGEGDPVLLLHGIGGSSASFAALAELLAAGGHRAIAWDAPGYGDSDDPSEPPGPDDYPDLALELLRGRDAEPAHVVGVSWGGVIATRLAARHPGSVRSLTLIDSTRGSGTDQTRSAAMLARLDDLREQGAAEFARRRAPKLTAPGADPAVAAEVLEQMSRIRLAGYRGAAEMMAATDNEPLLAELAVPTLVVVGEHDLVTGVAESELLADRIPGAACVRVPDAGHAAVQERPHEVAAALTDFLRRVEEAS